MGKKTRWGMTPAEVKSLTPEAYEQIGLLCIDSYTIENVKFPILFSFDKATGGLDCVMLLHEYGKRRRDCHHQKV